MTAERDKHNMKIRTNGNNAQKSVMNAQTYARK